jgi:hypothetical protein
VAELEEKFGKLKVYKGRFWYNDNDARPHEVEEIDDADGDGHFLMSGEQWTKLRRTFGGPCLCCENKMSVFTYYNRASVDVKSILDSLNII